jgi:hypothetical protein
MERALGIEPTRAAASRFRSEEQGRYEHYQTLH